MAELSDTLFYVALGLYVLAMVGYFFAMAFTRVSVDGVIASTRAGDRAGRIATGLAVGGVSVHLGSSLLRGLDTGRIPLGNMFEYSSVIALLAVAGGLVFVQARLRHIHLMGFVLAAAVLMMGSGWLLFVPAGPLVPALESYWFNIHVTAMVSSAAVFLLAFLATALYLARDTAERRVAARSGAGYRSGTVGAASVDVADHDTATATTTVVSPLELRRVLSPVWFVLVPAVLLGLYGTEGGARGAVGGALIGGGLGAWAWYALPHLPAAAELDALAYRITAFAMPIYTFGVICGAIWAEEAWGRYWGWDPKETGAFFTWILYAAYLHARATHGWRGRRAAWVGVAAYVALLVTYFVVNLVVVGLHSYAT
ncbi:MAG: c-type cytochrome biogenesis protein CcsB [Actinobacteria bacterium]|nr:c-type cytochrome biogenesis protein CcsB [Actinomycetota bacterium]